MLYFKCVMAVCALYPFLMIPRIGLQSVIVAIPGHNRLLLNSIKQHRSLSLLSRSLSCDILRR